MTAEEALAVRRQRNSREARAARGRQLLQVSAAPEPEPETSGSSVQVSPGVRRVSLFQCQPLPLGFPSPSGKVDVIVWLFGCFSHLLLPQCVDKKI